MIIYAVGDIHGMRYKLAKALAYLRANLAGDDYAVFLGDYIDRGGDSKGVVDDLIEFAAEYPRTVFLRGNHEEWLLHCHRGGGARDWLRYGGLETLRSYGAPIERRLRRWQGFIPERHMEFYTQLALDHRSENHWFVHAGLVPHPRQPGAWSPDLWVRDEFINDDSDFGRLAIFGHTPQILPYVPLAMPNKVCLDTGAAFGGPLTVAGFDDSRDWRGEVAFSIYQGLVVEDYLIGRHGHVAHAIPRVATGAPWGALEGAA